MAVEETRRRFFSRAAQGIGALALASLLPRKARAADAVGGLPGLPHFAPKAKRCIYLHLVGAPPQMETFDYKPKMKELFDKDLPESIRNGQRLTTMTSGQTRFPIAPSIFQFAQHGKSGAWVSELLPYTARMVDDIAIIRSMHTEAINHEPAITFFQTGLMVAGRPCIGSLAQLRPGQHESEPADVRRAAGQTQSPQGQRAGHLRAPVERRLPLRPVLRREPAQRGRPGALHQQSRRRARGSAPPHARCACPK